MSVDEKVLYIAPRGEEFKCVIQNILSLGRLKKKYIDLLTDDDSMKIFSQVFTHPTIDPVHNYEFYEILGDQTVNKAIVWYLSRRFPELHSPTGVKIISRLKINLVAKKIFAELGESLNLWDFVSLDEETKMNRKKKTLEDVFEALFGAIETILDTRIRNGVGYAISYNIIEALFDDMDISVKYEDLYDAKTRLKETFDWHRDKLRDGLLTREKYETNKVDKINYVSVFNETILPNGQVQRNEIGRGSAALKEDAEQKAALSALSTLKRLKWLKPVPEEYSYFESLPGQKKKSK